MSNHLAELLYKVLKSYGVSIIYQTVEREINTHPDFLSMRSISDALDTWKIKHVIMRISVEKLHALDVPVIAYLKRGEYVLVTRVAESEVHYWNRSKTYFSWTNDHSLSLLPKLLLLLFNATGCSSVICLSIRKNLKQIRCPKNFVKSANTLTVKKSVCIHNKRKLPK